MMQKLTIRQFELSDLERIHQIERSSFKYPWAKGDFIYHYLASREGFLVAALDSTIVGFIIVAITLQGRGHILNLAVDPKYRHLGVGRALVEFAVGKLKNEGVQSVWLEVRISNTGARKFYKELGFREVRILKNYYLTEDAIVMAKEI